MGRWAVVLFLVLGGSGLAYAEEDGTQPAAKERHLPVLNAERARILMRSLTVPGWGQATIGRRASAKAFGLAEAGIWTSFVAFRVQEVLRRHSSQATARISAGIDLDGRDEEF